MNAGPAGEQERVVTSNAWAFRLWLNRDRTADGQVTEWEPLRRASPAWFDEQVAAFARLGPGPQYLARHAGEREALVLLSADGSRRSFSRDDLLADRQSAELPAMLRRRWPRRVLAQGLVETLLRQDIRADDRVVVERRLLWPGLTVLLEGATVILFSGAPEQLATAAATEQARAY